MSEAQTPAAPAEEYVPQHVLSSETNEDATQPLEQPGEAPAEPEQEPPAEKPPEDPAKAERRRESQRIAALTRLRYQEKARADAAEAKLRELDPNAGAGPSQEQIQQWIDAKAEEKLQQREWSDRFAAWDSAGQETYGRERFLEACQTMANLASGSPAQRAALVDVALDIEGGQRAIVELADNPEEAERVLALPPHRMALAVQKLAGDPATKASVGKVQPVSSAPAPIRPPTVGRPRSEPDPEKGTMDSYAKWSAAQKWRS